MHTYTLLKNTYKLLKHFFYMNVIQIQVTFFNKKYTCPTHCHYLSLSFSECIIWIFPKIGSNRKNV